MFNLLWCGFKLDSAVNKTHKSKLVTGNRSLDNGGGNGDIDHITN